MTAIIGICDSYSSVMVFDTSLSMLGDEDVILEERFARDMIKHLVESGEDEYAYEEQDDYDE